MERFASIADRESEESSIEQLLGAVKELISLMSTGGISELDLTSGDVTIRLRGTMTGEMPFQGLHQPPAELPAHASSADEGHLVTAPMIGTYYSAPSPGDDPFVQIGDEVEVGQVVGIIEAMKIMNEIVADKPGVVSDILVENAQAVEYGSPLMRLSEQTDAYM